MDIQKKDHRDRLLEAAFDIPARGIAVVRKDGVDASNGLLRLLLVELVLGAAILLRDGQHARCGDGFEGGAGTGMAGAETDGNSVTQEDERGSDGDGGQEAFNEEERGRQRFPSLKKLVLSYLTCKGSSDVCRP